MKLLQEIGLEILRLITLEIKRIQNTNPQILKRKLVDTTWDIVMNVVSAISTMTTKFMVTAHAVNQEWFRPLNEKELQEKVDKELKQRGL